MSKESRFLGFKKEICVKDGSSWADQTFTVRAKFEVRTLTGLEDLIYEVKRVLSWDDKNIFPEITKKRILTLLVSSFLSTISAQLCFIIYQ